MRDIPAGGMPGGQLPACPAPPRPAPPSPRPALPCPGPRCSTSRQPRALRCSLLHAGLTLLSVDGRPRSSGRTLPRLPAALEGAAQLQIPRLSHHRDLKLDAAAANLLAGLPRLQRVKLCGVSLPAAFTHCLAECCPHMDLVTAYGLYRFRQRAHSVCPPRCTPQACSSLLLISVVAWRRAGRWGSRRHSRHEGAQRACKPPCSTWRLPAQG